LAQGRRTHGGGGSGTDIRTFLIADVRGYTKYTQEQGDQAAATLTAAFAELVEDVVGEHGGFLLERRGDEGLVVFVSARDALRAAVALQARFRKELPLGVGIGLDAGEAVPVGDGYRGGALNLAARLCARAPAGQILASEAVIHLAARVDGISYADARTLRLKGYAQPVRVVDVRPASATQAISISNRVGRMRSVLLNERVVWFGIAVAVVLGALFWSGRRSDAPPSDSGRTTCYSYSISQQRVGRVINQIRMDRDSAPLRLDPELSRVADQYLVDTQFAGKSDTYSPRLARRNVTNVSKVDLMNGSDVGKFDFGPNLFPPSTERYLASEKFRYLGVAVRRTGLDVHTGHRRRSTVWATLLAGPENPDTTLDMPPC
jgi:class 3 adenylate cyclase